MGYIILDQKYIDLFFEKGILRISSFKKFKNNPDEIRGDKSKGVGAFKTMSKEGSQFFLMTNTGESEYILCSSLTQSEEIKKKFGVDSFQKIIKPLGFSAAISNSIPGCGRAFLGFCNYQDHRIHSDTRKNIPSNRKT